MTSQFQVIASSIILPTFSNLFFAINPKISWLLLHIFFLCLFRLIIISWIIIITFLSPLFFTVILHSASSNYFPCSYTCLQIQTCIHIQSRSHADSVQYSLHPEVPSQTSETLAFRYTAALFRYVACSTKQLVNSDQEAMKFIALWNTLTVDWYYWQNTSTGKLKEWTGVREVLVVAIRILQSWGKWNLKFDVILTVQRR